MNNELMKSNVLTGNKNVATTLNLETKENKVKLYNALQQCDVRINDIKGQVIEIKDVYIEEKEIYEYDENGEVKVVDGKEVQKTKFRTIIFGVDGKTYVSSAYGVVNSMRTIISIFGLPTEENIIKVKVGTRPTQKPGQESLILTVIE